MDREAAARGETGAPPAAPADGSAGLAADRRTKAARLAAYLAAPCIVVSVLIMIAVSAAGPSRAVIPMPAVAGPPWWLALHPSRSLVTFATWAAAVLGGAGVAAGLIAVARGARPPARLLLGGALAAVAVLAVLPPAGSSDAADYAAYGRMVVLGHSPYVMTPAELRRTGDPVGEVAYRAASLWRTSPSAYGPLASAEQWAAAELGGMSAARIAFWLKVWNAAAFAAVAIGLDRLLRRDPAMRARAHLIWSANPLLLWGLVAAGHVDAIAAATGFAGLMTLRVAGRGRALSLPRAALAGLLVGAAVDVKVSFVTFGVGLALAARRSAAAFVAAGAGAVAILLPSYLWFGRPALAVLTLRSAESTADNFYALLGRALGQRLPVLELGAVAFVLLSVLLLWRLPEVLPDRPAVRPALAVSLGWLLTWPYQRPWYDAMGLCLLALFPSRLDWPILARLGVVTLFYMPGLSIGPSFALFRHELEVAVVPLTRLLALGVVCYFCCTRRWGSRPPPWRPAGLPAAVPRRV